MLPPLTDAIWGRRRWLQLPRRLQEMKAVLSAVTEKLTHQLGRAPTVGEIAAPPRRLHAPGTPDLLSR